MSKYGNYKRPTDRKNKSDKLQGSQKLAMFLFVGVGIMMGYSADQMVTQVFGERSMQIEKVAHNAVTLYQAEEHRSVEMTAIDQEKIENWFASSIKFGFKVPDLGKFDFEFTGARFSHAKEKPAAYLEYINDEDQKVAIFLARAKSLSPDLKKETIGSDHLFSIHKDGYGLVVISKMPEAKLDPIANFIFEQL